MKLTIKFFVLMLVHSYATLVAAQTNLILKYDPASQAFKSRSSNGLKVGETYQVVVIGGHNGLFDIKVSANGYDQNSKAPEVLKFLSISETTELRTSFSARAARFELSELIGDTATTSRGMDPLQLKRVLENQLNELESQIAFLEAATTLIGGAPARWKIGTLGDAGFYDAIEELLKTLPNWESKSSTIQTFRTSMHYSSLINSLTATTLEDGNYELNVLDTYAEFLERFEVVSQNSAKYIAAIGSIFQVLKYKNCYNDGEPAEGSTYINYLSPKRFTTEGDLTKLEINLISKLSKDTVHSQTLNYYSYGQWKFDFSTGFYGNDLTNRSYSIISYDADSSFVTLQKDYDNNRDIAIGGQLHLTYKASDAYGVGLNIGSAVSIIDASTRYLAGIHVVFGRSKQMMLSYGLAISKVKRLSEAITQSTGFVERGNEITVPVAFKEPKLVDQVTSGSFVGLSYNLSSVFKARK